MIDKKLLILGGSVVAGGFILYRLSRSSTTAQQNTTDTSALPALGGTIIGAGDTGSQLSTGIVPPEQFPVSNIGTGGTSTSIDTGNVNNGGVPVVTQPVTSTNPTQQVPMPPGTNPITVTLPGPVAAGGPTTVNIGGIEYDTTTGYKVGQNPSAAGSQFNALATLPQTPGQQPGYIQGNYPGADWQSKSGSGFVIPYSNIGPFDVNANTANLNVENQDWYAVYNRMYGPAVAARNTQLLMQGEANPLQATLVAPLIVPTSATTPSTTPAHTAAPVPTPAPVSTAVPRTQTAPPARQTTNAPPSTSPPNIRTVTPVSVTNPPAQVVPITSYPPLRKPIYRPR